MKTKSVKAKLLTATLAVVVVSNAVIGLIPFGMSRSEMESSVRTTMETVAKNISIQIDEMNQKEFRMLGTLAQLNYMRDSYVPIKEKIAFMSKSTTAIDKNYMSVSAFDAFGYTFDEDGKRHDMDGTVMFDQTMLGKKSITDPEEVGGALAMVYSSPIFDEDLQPSGAVYAIVKADRMSAICSSITIGKNSHPKIVNRKSGMVVGSADIGEIKNKANIKITLSDEDTSDYATIIRSVCKGESSWGTYTTDGGEKMAVAYQPIGSSCDWAVICEAPYSDYFGTLQKMSFAMLVTISVSIAVAIIGAVAMLNKMFKPLVKVKKSINEIATGNADLTKRIPKASEDEIGDVVNGFNSFSEKLQQIISDIKLSKNVLSSTGSDLKTQISDTNESISEILSTIHEINADFTNHANGVSITSNAVQEITAKIESQRENIEEQARNIAEASTQIEEMIGNIAAVNDSMDSMAISFRNLTESAAEGTKQQNDVNEKIKKIEEESKLLTQANAAISTIASETNLLAMNAAIEAAHAGDAGRGFSVVADEIRALSETSSIQSKSIGKQLKEIDASIKEMVLASERSKESFAVVSSQISETSDVVNRIKDALEEQSNGSKHVGKSLETMNEKTIFVKTASEEMTSSSEGIQRIITSLKEETGEFFKKMSKMNEGAERIRDTSAILDNLSESVGLSIDEIGKQIERFKV